MSRLGLEAEMWKCRNASVLRRAYVHLVGWCFLGGWLRLREIEKELGRHDLLPRLILDAGCGPGENSLFLARRFPMAQITAVDWEATESFRGHLDQLRNLVADRGISNVSVRKQNLLELNETARYDLILNVDVLEHIPENRKVLAAFHKALRPGGVVVMHMPARGRPAKSRLFPYPVLKALEEEHIGDMYRAHELQTALESMGFERVSVTTTFHWFAQTAWEWDKICYHAAPVLYPLLLPLLKALGWLDLYLKLDRGFGLLAVARRPGKGG
ncbi:MAG: class I SAM-dependent methyltransferase [Acidobacteriota bacterium]